MSAEEFNKSLIEETPPSGISPLLAAMWYDGKGDWERAHHIAQDIHTNDGSWIHAYLHRKEGDNGNASYWYHRAGKKFPAISLDEEWMDIVRNLLKK